MNGQLIVFSYFCRKYAALGKMEASFFALVDVFVDN